MPATGLPFLPQWNHERLVSEKAQVPALQVAIYAVTVAGQNIWFLRRYEPGVGVEVYAYAPVGAMVGYGTGTGEQVDDWSE